MNRPYGVFVLLPLLDQPLDDAAGDAAPLPADVIAELGHARSLRAAGAVDRFRRDVEPRHDARILADEIEFGDVFEKPQAWGKHQAAAVGAPQLVGPLGALGLGLLLGDERADAVSDFHLHVGNARARRAARRVL